MNCDALILNAKVAMTFPYRGAIRLDWRTSNCLAYFVT